MNISCLTTVLCSPIVWLLNTSALLLPTILMAESLALTSPSSPIGGRGLTYEGRPVFLNGSGSFWLLNDPYYYNQDGSTNLDTLRQHLDKYQPANKAGNALGVIRVSAFGTPVRYSGVNSSRKRYPCERSSMPGARDGGNKFNCSLLDQGFFHHVLTTVREAAQRGIMIGIILWDEIALERGSVRWAHNPFCPDNSVVDYGLPSCESNAVPDFHDLGNPTLRLHQRLIAEKFVGILKDEPNVFFFISNEYTGSSAWRDEQIETVNQANTTHATNILHVTMHYRSHEPSALSDGVASDTNKSGLKDDAFRADGRPAINQRDYRVAGSAAAVRQNIWARFMDGAASAGTRDDYSGAHDPSTTFAVAAQEDQRLRDFVNSIESRLDMLVPTDQHFSSGWRGRVSKGREYVAFSSSSGGSISVDLSSEDGTWALFEWDVTSGGAPVSRAMREGGQYVTWKLSFTESAVRIVKSDGVVEPLLQTEVGVTPARDFCSSEWHHTSL